MDFFGNYVKVANTTDLYKISYIHCKQLIIMYCGHCSLFNEKYKYYQSFYNYTHNALLTSLKIYSLT